MKINPKALELIARDMGEQKTGWQLVSFLKEIGIPEKLIIYPNTKWRMINDIFNSLLNENRQESDMLFMKILTEFVHPLNLKGNTYYSNILIDRYNSWLEFDGWKIERQGAGYAFALGDTVWPDEVIEDMKKYYESQEQKNSSSNSISNDQIKKQVAEFNELESTIVIGEIKIPVPYASYQFQLCKCIFKKQNKRWEYDELLEKFGIDDLGNDMNRKVYDAMLAVNKKVSELTKISDLILYDRKTFLLNPLLASKK